MLSMSQTIQSVIGGAIGITLGGLICIIITAIVDRRP